MTAVVNILTLLHIQRGKKGIIDVDVNVLTLNIS